MRTLTSWTSFTQQEVITVLIGQEQRAFHLHKQLLTDKSLYFQTCLKECWNTKKDTIELRDLSVKGFGVVVDVMYTDKLPDYLIKAKNEYEQFTLLLFAYRAADILMMTELQNRLIDLTVSTTLRSDRLFTLSTVYELCWQNLVHTKLYDLVFTQAVRNYITKPPSFQKCKRYMDFFTDYPHIHVDILTSINMYLQIPWPRLKDIDVCQYHIHKHNESCKGQPTRETEEPMSKYESGFFGSSQHNSSAPDLSSSSFNSGVSAYGGSQT